MLPREADFNSSFKIKRVAFGVIRSAIVDRMGLQRLSKSPGASLPKEFHVFPSPISLDAALAVQIVKIPLLALIVALSPAPALAFQVVDGSDQALSDAERRGIPAIIGEQLKDPVSAQYRKLHRAGPGHVSDAKGTRGYWCGEVNAKNSYGGYTGFRAFYVSITHQWKVETDRATDDLGDERVRNINNLYACR